ncbi:hypothetical protein JMJ35_001966 [Cladonia borealis]|uniref:Translin n=1 Tax=Cladonia borealis TaxID=184061 RepID=A0AA39R6R1_9LECA|nr:hypothetical protein JMJ35_001966 [Cladonia borealis]
MASAAVFEQLQLKLDEDSQIREDIRNVVQTLERQARSAESILTRFHSIPQANIGPTLTEAWEAIQAQRETLAQLNQLASKHPYYKYNQMWSRRMESVSFHLVFYGFLCSHVEGFDGPQGMLYTIEEVSDILAVPFNLKDQDAFHLTIEEYLLSLILLIDELARLAINSVTLGDYQVPLRISQFVKDLHAGFQVLNLKNDILRKRSDSIKYSVKKIEEVVYDLSLRNLIP